MCYSLGLYITSSYVCFASSDSVHTLSGCIQIPVDKGSLSSVLLYELSVFLEKNNINSLKTVCCPRGPQSFTTLRIALSVAQGLALSYPNCQLFTPTHDALYRYIGQGKGLNSFLITLPFKGNIFYTFYVENGTMSEIQILSSDDINHLYPKCPILREDQFLNKDYNLATTLLAMLQQQEGPFSDHVIPEYGHTPLYKKLPTQEDPK